MMRGKRNLKLQHVSFTVLISVGFKFSADFYKSASSDAGVEDTTKGRCRCGRDARSKPTPSPKDHALFKRVSSFASRPPEST
eukprot:3934074-Rhodomonas_salina.1